MTRFYIYIFILLLPVEVFGQKAKISFANTSCNIGKIKEDGGKVTHEFKFINKGKAPLIIKYVETSCGCTVPKWNRRPISPQDSGVITIVFNPKDRLGTFSKKIIVYTNATPPNIMLKLDGEVVAKPTDILSEYPFYAGDLRFNTDTIRMKQLEIKQQIINLINTGKRDILILSISKPDYLEVDCTPLILEKGMMGNIIIRYDPQEKDKIKSTDYIVIKTNQGETRRISIINN